MAATANPAAALTGAGRHDEAVEAAVEAVADARQSLSVGSNDWCHVVELAVATYREAGREQEADQLDLSAAPAPASASSRCRPT